MPKPTDLSLDLLRTFLAVVRHGGDAIAAADELQLTQPAVSRRLSSLQHAGDLLEHPWLVRVGKTWYVTEAGRRVRPAVEEIVRRHELLTSALEADHEPARVTVAASRPALMGFVLHAVRQFRDDHGEMARVLGLGRRARIEGVANGYLDLAVVGAGDTLIREVAHRPLHIELLALDRPALVAARNGPWADRLLRLDGPADVANACLNAPLLLPIGNNASRRNLERTVRAVDPKARLEVVAESADVNVILTYARDGIGIGLVSESALIHAAGLAQRLLPSRDVPACPVRLIARRRFGADGGLDLSPSAQRLRELLRHSARRLRVNSGDETAPDRVARSS